MKFAYDGDSADELIKKYDTTQDKIIVTFLDGSSYEIPLTDKNESDLLRLMLEQATNRNNNLNIDEEEKKLSRALWMIPQAMILTVGSIKFCTTDSVDMKLISGFLCGIGAFTLIVTGLEFKAKKEEIAELKKYDIYLAIKDSLENDNTSSLFKGVNKKQELNINTLDNYSLRDLKKIKANLVKLSGEDKQVSSSNVMVKKF